MKKLKLFFALFAMLALGVGNAWAETIFSDDFANVGNGSNTEIKTRDGWSGFSKCYAQGNSGLRLGSSSAGGSITKTAMSSISGTKDIKVTIYTSRYNKDANTFTISCVNGTISSITGVGTLSSGKVTISPSANAGVTSTTAGATWEDDFKTEMIISASSSTTITFATNERAILGPITIEDAASTDEPGSTEPALSSIEISGDLTNKTYEEGDELDLTGLTVLANYESGDPKDVTNDVEWSYEPLTAGQTSVTVTATYEGLEVSKTIDDLTVTEHVVNPGTYTGNLNNVFFGCATGNNATEQSGKFNDVLVVAGCKSSASSKTYYDAGHVRFYADSYLTLSVPVGYVIKSIVFTADGTWNGSITASAGTYDNNSKTWTGNAQEVKFSFAQQNRIKSVKVTYAADVKYAVNITTPSNGTLVVKEGSTVLTDGALVYEGTKLVVTPTPNAGYVFESLTVDGSAVELTDGTYTFNMPASDVTITATFKENEKPAATLTLSKNGETEDITGYKQDDKVTLPSITSDCVKEFVGWSDDANCATEPEYKAGDEYTLVETAQTLYAVYAKVEGGGETTASVNMATYASANSWGSTSSDNQKQITINSDVKAVISEGGNSGKYYSDGVRIYQSESATVTISTTVGELKSVKFTFTNSSDGTLLYGSTKLTSNTAVAVNGTSAVFSVSDTHATENKGQIRFTAIEVVYTGGVAYSNYSTTCAAALDEPVFSVEGGENEAKTITLTATEGTIYYTLDGTTPTSASEKYTTPIVLDECGEHTIKAIAISSDSESPVASATYEIQLPILANSEIDPYTETEAVEVYNGGCYDGEELVYVKGTVQTAQFYNSGTYTITLTGGMQFYYFYEGADEDVFESDYINEGDDIVACGKLSMYNTIYQLANGCYLVKHKPVAQLSWSKSTCTAEIGGTNEFPTLTNTNSVAVSYSSSNTAAATINETTGEIALVAAGETTITATFAGNENYKANSASYTLTVAEAVVRGTITYNTNGGTEVAAQENQTNLPETLPTTTKAGYNFGGWYTDAECNTPAVANSVLTGDITLHAKWLEPYTVAQALAMNVTTGVYVKGIISTITEVNTDYKNATYKISDDGTTTSEMIVYRGKNVDNTDFTSEDQIAVGDIVVIYGNLSEYNSAIQLAQGNYIYSLTEPTLYTVTISFETNGGEPVESIEANTLPDPFPTTTKEGHAFDGWYMDNALTIPAVAGTPITTDADITLYAKWTEVSKWATTYTSNIEVGSDEVIINGTEYEAKKTGTSSAYGSTSVVVPVSTHTLHFHAAGWGADNLVNLVVKNGETVLGTFELSKDAGVKSNSPYTLAGTPYQQYYSVSLTNITAETTITFEASTSGGKRFVLYGVNQEGGIVPELNRIEIIGEATELTYEIGDVFNPAGLGVNAIYTLAGVDHETVAIDAEDVEWSFNPATIAAETSQVEVTATYMEKTATKTVADLTVNVPTPEITATPASIDWGTVNKDSEASKEVSVTLKAVANATISISGTNPSTFSVDKTALTETGTIVVSANTSSVGTFTATLTISDDAAAAEEKKISLKIIVEGIDDVYGNWQLVTDAFTLKAGMEIIIASVEVDGKYYTMGKQNSNNRAAIESTVSETQLTPTTGTSVLTLVDAGDGKFAFQASNGKYLSAAGTGTSNYLREAENYDSDETKWTISVTAEGIATIKATSDNRNWMRYNPNNGSPLFSCYGSGQTDIALYARVPDHIREVPVGYFATICVPNNIVKVVGATLYKVAGKENGKLYFDEVLVEETEEGMPYVFFTDAATQEFYYGSETTDIAGEENSLRGTFVKLEDGALKGHYMLQSNKIIKCADTGCWIDPNRAYFDGNDLSTLGKPSAQMPGRRRVSMGAEEENETTGTENIVAPEGQTLKLIENGQLIIIRNGEKFNAQGVRL